MYKYNAMILCLLFVILCLDRISGECTFPCTWQQTQSFTIYVRSGNNNFNLGSWTFSTTTPGESIQNFAGTPANLSCVEIQDQFLVVRDQDQNLFCFYIEQASGETTEFYFTQSATHTSGSVCDVCDMSPDGPYIVRDSSAGEPAVAPTNFPCLSPYGCTPCSWCDVCTTEEVGSIDLSCPADDAPAVEPITTTSHPRRRCHRHHGRNRK